MDEHVFRVVKGDENTFRFNVKFIENGFDITVFKDDCAWGGKVDKRDVKNLARELGTNENDYYENVSGMFKNAPDELLQFNSTEFVIYNDLETNLKIKYFQCKLKSVNFNESVYNLLDKFYDEKVQLGGDLEVSKKEVEEVKLQNAEYEANINEFVNRKADDDNELLNKFVTVLNEKKRRIQHLTELLDAFKNGHLDVNSGKTVKVEKNSLNGDSSDSGTDEDVPLKTKKRKLEETPSTSKLRSILLSPSETNKQAK